MVKLDIACPPQFDRRAVKLGDVGIFVATGAFEQTQESGRTLLHHFKEVWHAPDRRDIIHIRRREARLDMIDHFRAAAQPLYAKLRSSLQQGIVHSHTLVSRSMQFEADL